MWYLKKKVKFSLKLNLTIIIEKVKKNSNKRLDTYFHKLCLLLTL